MHYVKEQKYFQGNKISFLHKLQSPDVLEKVLFS